MKITAPDDVEILADETVTAEEKKDTFEDEIKEILRMPQVPPKFIVDEDDDRNNSEFKRQVLFKFTQLCREEIFPRHVKVADTIESKMDDLHCQLAYQEKELEHLLAYREALREDLQKLEEKRVLAQTLDQQLNIRLKEVIQKLQDRCRNRSWAEKKMAHDLIDFKKRVDDLKVTLVETKAKMNYYISQIKARTETVNNHSKPFYLDNNKAAVMRENLNDMRGNIEQLVRRVKKLKAQVEVTNN